MQMPASESATETGGPRIGNALGHRIFYALIRIAGRRAAYALLRCVVFYYVLLRPSVRRTAAHYLRRRFPEHTPVERFFDSYRMSFELGKVLVDRAVMGIRGPGEFQISLSGREQLQELLAEGNGLVLVTAHVGCWQVAMATLGCLEAPVSMLMRREDGEPDRHYFEHSGESPYRIIDPTGFLGGALEMLGVLKRGEVLCVMGDRVMGSAGNAVPVDFLGDRAFFPFSAFKLASTTGAPVVVMFTCKTGPDSYALELARVIRVPQNLGRSGAAAAPYVAEFAQSLEGFVEKHPYQFFNFFDLWTQVADSDS
jgi:predicted LPLAT superfamily acyltransferase